MGVVETAERPCRCQGSNENCRMCFGRGSYQVLGYSAVSSLSRKVPPTARVKIPAAKPRNIAKLLTEVTAEPLRVVQKPKGMSFFTDIRKCRYCGQKMHQDSIDGHIRRKHKEAQNAFQAKNGLLAPLHSSMRSGKECLSIPKKVPLMNVSQWLCDTAKEYLTPMLDCPECGVQIKSKNIESHLRRAHCSTVVFPSLPVTQKKAPKLSSSRLDIAMQSEMPLDVNNSHTNQQYSANHYRDTHEAHHNMGYLARESGKYGSHPLHDRFDDESHA